MSTSNDFECVYTFFYLFIKIYEILRNKIKHFDAYCRQHEWFKL